MSAGLRERLLARERPTTTVPLRVEDDTDARRRLADAEQALAEIQDRATSPGAQAVRKARQARDAAQQAVDDCYIDVTVQALPPADFEALIAAHPPEPAADGEASDDAWNPDTFPRPCFLACVAPTDDMSAEDWAQVFDNNLSAAEQTMLCNAAIMINVRRLDEIQVPKDWTQILDSL